MPYIYDYQMDGNDYVLDQGNKIVEAQYEYTNEWRALATSVRCPHFIYNFNIRKFNDGDRWLLIVNQKQLIGFYPSQDAAIDVLVGMMTRLCASEAGQLLDSVTC